MLAGLELLQLGPGRFEAPHVDGHGTGTIVFGGQLLAQLVAAASTELSEMPLTSMSAVFARPARLDLPILVDVDVLHRGRSAASATLRVHQSGSTCVSAVAVAMAPQPAFGEHSDSIDVSGGPDEATPLAATLLDVEARDMRRGRPERPDRGASGRGATVDAGPGHPTGATSRVRP